ncbi:MAG: hypothetical protein IT247_00795, partial [Bacteroidia bacterium]|nr:hypothetical protein [Bacteroidia bacterium]
MKNIKICASLFVMLFTTFTGFGFDLLDKSKSKTKPQKKQTTLIVRSKLNSTSASIMTIERNSNNDLIISNDTVPLDTSDKSTTYYYGNTTFSNGLINVPNDGRKYWFIAFNPNVNPPVKYVQNGGYHPGCTCVPIACEDMGCFVWEMPDNAVFCSGWCDDAEHNYSCPS